MTNFLDFLHDRIHGGGFTTEDALASLLPLMRQTFAAHRQGLVAPLYGVNELHVEGVKIWFAESQVNLPRKNAGRVRELDTIKKTALEVTGSAQLTTDVNQAETSFVNLQIGKRGEEIRRPSVLAGLRVLGTRGRPSRSAYRHLQPRHDPGQLDVQSRLHAARRSRGLRRVIVAICSISIRHCIPCWPRRSSA